MSVIKHSPFSVDDIVVPPSWTQDVEFLGQAHLRRDTDAATQISILVPHLTAKELSVELVGNTITVKGNHMEPGHADKFARHYVVETLEDASQIKANLYDGVLLLTIEKQPKLTQRIAITENPPEEVLAEHEEEGKSYL